MRKTVLLLCLFFVVIASGCLNNGPGIYRGGAFSYYSGERKITVQEAEVLESPVLYNLEWMPVDDAKLHGITNVLIGKIADITEISMTYDSMESDVTDYWSLFTVSVSDVIKSNGTVAKGDSITVLYELSSHRTENGASPAEKGKEYVFFLKKTSEIQGILDYSPIADYMYSIAADKFIPVDETQDTVLLELLGADEDVSTADLIEKLRCYYEQE